MIIRRSGRSVSAAVIVTPVLVLLLACSLTLSCRHPGGNIRLCSYPPGSEVVDLDDNSPLGITPCDSSFGGSKRKPRLVTVRFQKPGYRDRIVTFTDTGKPQTVAIEMQGEKEEDSPPYLHAEGNIHLRTYPPGTEVVDFKNNTLLGVTPCDTSFGGTIEKPRLVPVRFQKNGYRDRVMTITDTGKPQTVTIEMEEEQDED